MVVVVVDSFREWCVWALLGWGAFCGLIFGRALTDVVRGVDRQVSAIIAAIAFVAIAAPMVAYLVWVK